MTIIDCGKVVYLILGEHIARIERTTHDGEPTAWIFIDNKLLEGISAQCGLTLKYAFRSARMELRWLAHK